MSVYSTDQEKIPVLWERTFLLEDQLAFAEFSGDWNPLHVDPLYARRCLTGEVVVHGIHVLLWSLECLARHGRMIAGIIQVNAEFVRPVRLGERVVCRLLGEEDAGVNISVSSPGGEAVLASFAMGETGYPICLVAGERGNPSKSPACLTMADLQGKSGNLPFLNDAGWVSRLFPFLADAQNTVVLLAATSRLVGMVCPGLHSLFSELNLVMSPHEGKTVAQRLDYRVSQLDRRFGLVSMQIEGGGMTGEIRAFLRPPPSLQATMDILRNVVGEAAFSGQRALVVGGSRGLGELTAKLLAAGGADVCITYRQGRDDAEAVVAEIVAHGGKAIAVALDIQDSFDGRDVWVGGWHPTHLYYFATPFIFSGERGGFSAELLARFCTYYVSGFAQLVESLRFSGLEAVFYPSTVALDELPADMAEYCAAKAAGEALCGILMQRHSGLLIHFPRLPRLATDQTASLLPVQNLDPLPVMLHQLETFTARWKALSQGPESIICQPS